MMAAVSSVRALLIRTRASLFNCSAARLHPRFARPYSTPEHSSEGKINLQISDSCIARLKELGENSSLRIGVEGGGCSGFQYTFELDSPEEEGDLVVRKEGVRIIVDETSLNYLNGATLEYHTELIRSAFRIVNNPVAEQGCSCGASFNLKVD